MSFNISAVRHPKEKLYGFLTLSIGMLVWALLATALVVALMKQGLPILFVVLLYGVMIWFFSFVTRALLRAYMLGHYVMISGEQFPHLNQMVIEGAQALGLKDVPKAFVYNSHGITNAMALKLVGHTRYIWLTSALVDVDDDEQVKFVIGHELGHHIAGHLDEPWSLLRLPGLFFPFLGPAYSRARELTCDRVGLIVSGKLHSSRTALQMLACGSAKLNAQLNPTAFAAQEHLIPPIAGFFVHIFSLYPSLARRVAALGEWRSVPSDLSSAPAAPIRGGRIEPSLA